MDPCTTRKNEDQKLNLAKAKHANKGKYLAKGYNPFLVMQLMVVIFLEAYSSQQKYECHKGKPKDRDNEELDYISSLVSM